MYCLFKEALTKSLCLFYRLCKLLTNPVTEVKDLTADFLFVLCKEKGKYLHSVEIFNVIHSDV